MLDQLAEPEVPDGNGPGRDWVTDCVAQTEVYGVLDLALEALLGGP